jgi:hypothetical protein
MRLRSALALIAAVTFRSVAATGQGATIDEGTFVITQRGSPMQTESFRIARLDNGMIRATGQIAMGDNRVSSSLTADSSGTPAAYGYVEKTRGVTTLQLQALGGGRRLSLKSSDNRNNEAMKDFPISPGRSLILDEGLMHQLYFAAASKRTGQLEVIMPRRARREAATLSNRGPEPVTVAGRSVTGTHYSLVDRSMAREFWIDDGGRVLRVEIPVLGLVAVREDLPR